MPDKKSLIFFLVSAAIFIDMMVYSLVIPVLPSYSMSLGADEVAIGIIFGAFSVALLIFSIPFGLLSDRTGKRLFMVIGMLTLAAANITFALSSNIYVLIFARLIQGMSGAATWSAGLALLADTFEPSERGEKLGLAMSIMSVGTLLGPMIGGLLYDNFGYIPTFIIPSIMACIVGILFLVAKIPSYRTVDNHKTDYISPIYRAPTLFMVCCLTIIAGAASFGILEPYMPVYLYKTFTATPTMIGLTFGTMSIFSMIAQPLAGKVYDARGGRLIVSAGLILSAFIMALSMIMPSLYLTSAIFALLGITMGFVLTPMMPLLSDLYGGDGENNSQGLVYGVYNTLFSLGLVVGPFAGGIIISKFMLPATIFGHALLLAIIGALCYAFINEKRPYGR